MRAVFTFSVLRVLNIGFSQKRREKRKYFAVITSVKLHHTVKDKKIIFTQTSIFEYASNKASASSRLIAVHVPLKL